jgi:hypothetical protein
MDDTIDLLQVKIENAKRQLPEDTQNAIAAVDWKAAILSLRAKNGYTFEQLGDLELETELLLAGLVSPENYPKELGDSMGLSKREVDELVNNMNEQVFTKIKEELIKNTERKKIFAKNIPISRHAEKEIKNDTQILHSAGIEIIPSPSVFSATDTGGEKKETLPVLEKLELAAEPSGNILVSDLGEKKPEPVSLLDMPNKAEPVTPNLGEKRREDVHPILAQKLSAPVQMPSVKTEYSLDNITKTTAPTSSYPPKADPYRLSPDE